MRNTLIILAILAVLYFLFKDKLNNSAPAADSPSGGGGGGYSGDGYNVNRQMRANTQQQQAQVKKAQQLAAPKPATGGNTRRGGLRTA